MSSADINAGDVKISPNSECQTNSPEEIPGIRMDTWNNKGIQGSHATLTPLSNSLPKATSSSKTSLAQGTVSKAISKPSVKAIIKVIIKATIKAIINLQQNPVLP